LNEERTSVIELSVAKEDLGRVIGKQGRTATAMRTILGAVSEQSKKHFVLEKEVQAELALGNKT